MVMGSSVLARNPVLPLAQDYAALKAEAIAAVQRLCPSWTDFNAHDPGLTLIELFCFAVTDLGYRAGLPVEELLGAGTPNLMRPSLFASPPVTVSDFRRLLLDRVEGLGNIWLYPRGRTGLHDIRLHAALPLPGVHPEGRPSYRRLIERVRRAWERHRPLCEDIGSIGVLQPTRTVVRAHLRIARGAHAETILAQALFRIALTLAPEPRRRAPLEQKNFTQMPEGPLLLKGLIAPNALSEKPAVIESGLIWERIADIPGVLGVDNLRLWVEGSGTCSRVEVTPDAYCCLDAGFEEAALPLKVEQDGKRLEVDRDDVLRRLMRLWAAHRKQHPLQEWYRERSVVPPAKPRALRAFAPLGPQLPRVYGLSSGVPETAAARQLQGFLSLIEAPMRQFCDRIADLEMIEARDGNKIEPHWLDLLLALRGVAPPPAALPIARVPAAKRALLEAHGAVAQRRGRGFDPEARGGVRRLAGPELRMRLMLGAKVRVSLVEHVMLRPRSAACPAGEHESEGDMTVTAVVAGAEEERDRIAAMLRAEIPAHIGLQLRFWDGPRWRRFYHVHRLWRAALRLDELRATDELAAQLRQRLESRAE